MEKLTKSLHVKLAAQQLAALNALAKQEERTVSDTARRILRDALGVNQPPTTTRREAAGLEAS